MLNLIAVGQMARSHTWTITHVDVSEELVSRRSRSLKVINTDADQSD